MTYLYCPQHGWYMGVDTMGNPVAYKRGSGPAVRPGDLDDPRGESEGGGYVPIAPSIWNEENE
jgi:hypothetical protein